MGGQPLTDDHSDARSARLRILASVWTRADIGSLPDWPFTWLLSRLEFDFPPMLTLIKTAPAEQRLEIHLLC